MARYLIEVPHAEEKIACAKVVDVFLKSGSHYLTNADWGCGDGIHKSWFIADVDSKQEALGIVPPALRSQAIVISLNKFSMEEIDAILSDHKD